MSIRLQGNFQKIVFSYTRPAKKFRITSANVLEAKGETFVNFPAARQICPVDNGNNE